MNIKAMPGWCLIEPIEDEQNVGGIKLPDSTQDYPMKGKILNVGRAPYEYYMEDDEITHYYKEVAVDNTVYFKKFSGQDIKHEGKEYKLVEFKDLLAVVE